MKKHSDFPSSNGLLIGWPAVSLSGRGAALLIERIAERFSSLGLEGKSVKVPREALSRPNGLGLEVGVPEFSFTGGAILFLSVDVIPIVVHRAPPHGNLAFAAHARNERVPPAEDVLALDLWHIAHVPRDVEALLLRRNGLELVHLWLRVLRPVT